MLRANFARYSPQEQKLYKLIALAISVSFAIGLIWVLLGLSDQRPPSEDDWQPTTIALPGDPLSQFAIVMQKARWFSKQGKKITAAPKEDPLKALEGKPESLRLTGLVTQGSKCYALFISIIPPAQGARVPVQQLGEGDTLIGDWVIKTIGTNQVVIQQGDVTREVKMYQPINPAP